jgi:hypothetical protein
LVFGGKRKGYLINLLLESLYSLMKRRATGIGGIFFKIEDPTKTKKWYQEHLGLNTDQYGTTFEWKLASNSEEKGFTQWSPMDSNTEYFKPSEKDFLINYRVENLV